MSKIDDRARLPEPRRENARSGAWYRSFGRVRDRLQDWITGPDERAAREHGWTATRSRSGWSVDIRDPRFDRRHACDTCAGTGRHHITGADCADCDGVGVVTDSERGERA